MKLIMPISAVLATGRMVRLPGTRTVSDEPATHTRPDESTLIAGILLASGFQVVCTVAVILPVAGSTRTSPCAVSTHTTCCPGAICGLYWPGLTGDLRTAFRDLGSIKLIPA